MMDAQIILNIAFGTIMFLGGWLMKLILGHINEIKSNHEKLLIKHIEDMESLLEKHTNLALSMPEKYVSKDDFQTFVERIDHRFNRIEEKLDNLLKK
jgi:type IV secretory pathway ATPase VirB11/archaellum biosynthesis ATPase